jgi:hypothetical protein
MSGELKLDFKIAFFVKNKEDIKRLNNAWWGIVRGWDV